MFEGKGILNKIPSKYVLAMLGVALGAMALSFTGLIMRHIESADVWQILFFRSIGMIGTMSIFMAITQRGKFLKGISNVGWRGIIVACLIGPSFGFYILALSMITVAEVSFVISTLPLFTAFFAFIFLHERVRGSTWGAIIVVLCGVLIMFLDSTGQGASYLGIIVAFGVPITFAATIVIIRSGPDIDMIPATWMAGFVALIISIILAKGSVINILSFDMFLSLLMGCTLGLGFGLYTIGARYVAAAQVALLALLEQAFNPLWAWIGAGEIPSTLVLIGGLIVFCAVTVRAIIGVWEERKV
ncbi:MAG: hypothetical protein CMM30_06995 [Rhodospirillaceae bacterium]|nr:hypothetical protein [Rhodospirillaceae bacterium]|tara:strand:+ start:63 stop:965 length:903 start_codon:yes stop_codon:yes gene_type:complete